MVSVRRSHGDKPTSITSYFLIVVILVFMLLVNFTGNNENLSSSVILKFDKATLEDVLSLDPEVRAMRLWKYRLHSACQQFLQGLPNQNISEVHLESKEQIETEALRRMTVPNATTISEDRHQPRYKFCDHVFIDLGTNRGDSIACAVDASLDVCSALFLDKDPTIRKAYRVSRQFPRLHLDVNDLQIHDKGNQGLSLLKLLQDFFQVPGMESVCVYGMEGNPYFTQKLKKLNNLVNLIEPRPLRHIYIHTETIVASQDGPTSLYIDQYSEKNHFWGSSVMQSMPDIRRTSRQNNGTMIQAQVNGIALSTLLRKTLNPFNNPQSRKRGSLLVKMDVEGAEFGVLKELATTSVLCDYVQMGNNATLVVEFHQHLIKDDSEKKAALTGLNDAKETLRGCGVKFRQLPNFWT